MLDFITYAGARINAIMDRLLFAPLAFVVVLALAVGSTALFETHTGDLAASKLTLQGEG